MIIDTIVSIALKNCIEKYDIRRLSVFDINNISMYFETIHVRNINNNEFEFKVKCPICGEEHCYNCKIDNLIRGTMVIGGCEKIGVPILFIGKNEKVEEKINKYKEVNKKIYAMF